MKYLISRFSFLFFVLLVVQFSTAQRNVIDQVIWVVGDEPILLSDVENQKLQMQYQGEKIDGDPNCVIPEQIAIQKLFLHQAKLDSVVVGESAVNGEVDRRINYFIGQIGSKEKLEEYFNKPLAQIREELQGTVRDQMIVQQMQQKLIGDVKVTPEDVRKFFQELNPDSIPTVPATVEIQTITEYLPNDTIPEDYVLQIQTGLLVTRRSWCDFISYSVGLPMAVIRVFPDSEIQDAIVAAASSFESELRAKLLAYRHVLDSHPRLTPTSRRFQKEITL